MRNRRPLYGLIAALTITVGVLSLSAWRLTDPLDCLILHPEPQTFKIHSPLSEAAWQQLQNVPGIVVRGNEKPPSVQIIFDPHCPYCAKLYSTFQHEHPQLTTRWVPVAYFKPSSKALVAGIMQSQDPASSLDINFRGYDYNNRTGGYNPSPERQNALLNFANAEFDKQWRKWGGFTPMIIARTAAGEVLKFHGSGRPYLASLLHQIPIEEKTTFRKRVACLIYGETHG